MKSQIKTCLFLYNHILKYLIPKLGHSFYHICAHVTLIGAHVNEALLYRVMWHSGYFLKSKNTMNSNVSTVT